MASSRNCRRRQKIFRAPNISFPCCLDVHLYELRFVFYQERERETKGGREREREEKESEREKRVCERKRLGENFQTVSLQRKCV